MRKMQLLGTLFGVLLPLVDLMAQSIDPGCENYQAWGTQTNPRSDATGVNNLGFPEYNATYWSTTLHFPLGTTLTIRGQFPNARYMSFHVYDVYGNLLTAVHDAAINPDAGQNNPFRSGSAQGRYTLRLLFARYPDLGSPDPNNLYTRGLDTVRLFYRIYYPNDTNNLPGGPVDPLLPDIVANGLALSSCPPRPILLPEELTLAGRLDDVDYTGTPPPNRPASPLLPVWQFWVGSSLTPFTPFFTSQDNSYMVAVIDRTFLLPPHNFDMAVIRMKTPSFTNTQAGVPPYTAANTRFWSICQNELMTFSVVRCVPDNRAVTLDGFATFVISDPSKRPSDALLSRWGATWIPWGALAPNETIYGLGQIPFNNANGVFYYGLIIYRQTLADPNFPQSIANVSRLRPLWRSYVMGDYWPTLSYCTLALFETSGGRCGGRLEPQE